MTEGWSTDYYKIPEGAKELQDLIELKGMNFSVGNIFKAAYRLGAKAGVSAEYDLNKIKWFADRELGRLKSKEPEQLELDLGEQYADYSLYLKCACDSDDTMVVDFSPGRVGFMNQLKDGTLALIDLGDRDVKTLYEALGCHLKGRV